MMTFDATKLALKNRKGCKHLMIHLGYFINKICYGDDIKKHKKGGDVPPISKTLVLYSKS